MIHGHLCEDLRRLARDFPGSAVVLTAAANVIRDLEASRDTWKQEALYSRQMVPAPFECCTHCPKTDQFGHHTPCTYGCNA